MCCVTREPAWLELANDYLNWLLMQKRVPWSIRSEKFRRVNSIQLDRPEYKDDVQHLSSLKRGGQVRDLCIGSRDLPPPLGFLIAGGYCSFRILSTIMTASVMVIFASPFTSPMSISSMLMGAEPPVIGFGSCR